MLRKFIPTLLLVLFCAVLQTTNLQATDLPDHLSNYFTQVNEAVTWLKEHTKGAEPKLMIVLTGGLEGQEDLLTNKQVIEAADIPHFPFAHVQGHAGQLIFGRLGR